MPWLRHFALFLVFVAALFRPTVAGAFVSAPDANAQARVGAFELVAATLVGPASGATCGLHEGIGAAYDEKASGYRFAAGGATRAFGGLSRAAEFGLKPYGQLRQAIQGTGLQAHHLIEQQFAGVMGQNARQMMSVAVTPAEHQAFTNAWRALIPYGPNGTGAATREMVMDAARQINSSHPEILGALGL